LWFRNGAALLGVAGRVVVIDVRLPSEWPPAREHPEEAPPDRGLAEGVAIILAVGDVAAGDLLLEALRPLSPRVVLVASATLALSELDAARPALLIIDDELPLIRGLDVAGRVRGERADVDIILLTADEMVISLVGRLRVERIRCIAKPFDVEALRRTASLHLRALAERRTSPAYEDLLAELEDQKARFERRLKNLERRQASERPPPFPAATSAPTAPASASTSDAAPTGSPAIGPIGSAPGDATELPADLRVLVVDDDPVIRRALARRFSKHRVIFAENGVAATRELERVQPDVILSDLEMPEMDGLELADEVQRRWPELADRIIFVSGTGSQIQRAEEEAPAHPLLRKPVDGRLLESRIAEVLQNALFSRKS
ncbi:MAG TPA: response regulator, partial [Polyangiaceae bacterium]|nr:response regulator [Polyangiaceae bacterium]